MITGGIGTFGRAMTEYLIASGKPLRAIIFNRSELRRFEMRYVSPQGAS